MKYEASGPAALSNLSVRIMVAMLEEAGIDPSPMMRAACLEAGHMLDPEGRISAAQELRCQDAFVALTRHIPGFWMRTGLRYRIMSYGPLGLLLLSTQNVSAALRQLGRYQSLTCSPLTFSLEFDGEEPVAIIADDSTAPQGLREFLHERALGAVVMMLNDLRQRPFPLDHIESILDRPPNWLHCDDVLGVPVRFNAPQTKWVMKPGSGDEPMPMASPLLEETYQRLCDQLISQPRVRDDMMDRFYSVMMGAPKGFPTAIQVAEKLAISERTLHRRLAARGLVFSSVLDRIRERRAREYLESSRLSIAQIAEMLDFAETASFSRAFKRWTGMSPLLYRKTMTAPYR
jgi:AraC-like DNA-binding protein